MKKYNFPFLYFEATRKCNLTCPYCMSGCVNYQTKKNSAELVFSEILRLVLQPAKDLGVNQVIFSGGEFLLRDDALELIEASIKMDIRPKILTNGILVNEGLLKRIKQIAGRKCVLGFGINSVTDNSVQIKTRQTEIGRFMEAIRLCEKWKIPRHVIVTIGKFNLHNLDETLLWLDNNNIPFNRSPFVPRNMQKDHFSKWGFSKADMKHHIHPALIKRANGYFSFTPFFLSPELHSNVSGNCFNVTVPQNPSVGCWVGTWLAISPEGEVAPCATLLDELSAGNVREKSLIDIIEQSEIFQNLLDRTKLKGKCGVCRYRLTCGGCRALAFYSTGDYLAEDPSCFFEPDDFNTVSPLEACTNSFFHKYVRVARMGGMYQKPD